MSCSFILVLSANCLRLYLLRYMYHQLGEIVPQLNVTQHHEMSHLGEF
jgi:hypothetical protein